MAEARRLSRLSRLERVREVERRRAAEQAASSGSAHDRMRQLAERSQALAGNYTHRENMPDGAELAALLAFRRELSDLSHRTADDAEQARLKAEDARFALSIAQHRRDLVTRKLESARRDAAASQLSSEGSNLARSLNRKGDPASPVTGK